MELLQHYDWPGNVRQLLNVLNQTIALHECEKLRAEHLPAQLRQKTLQTKLPGQSHPEPSSVERAIERECERFVESLTRVLPSIEGVDFDYLQKRIKLLEGEVGRAIIEKGLSETKGDRQLLSKKLNITQRTLRYILNEKG